MIEFIVCALPRSATTWVSNWLTTDATICLHDPIATVHYKDWDGIESRKMLGVADTGIGMFPDWLNEHPARKVILHRPLDKINESMAAIGLPVATPEQAIRLYDIKGMHCQWSDVFYHPAPIYEFLTGLPFDAERHAELRKIQMQPLGSGLSINPAVVRRIISEIKELQNA